ncbi:MAG: phage minor head protein, partial [Bacteriovoracaceae bacterium]
DVNYASAKTAQYIFARYTIKPKMEKLVQQLNEFLLPMFVGTENMFLDYKSPVPEDEEAKFRKYESGLKFGWLTVNEVRSEEGLQPVDGGDDIRIPSNGGSIDEVGTEGKKLTVKQKKNFEHSSDRLYEMQARGKQYFEVEEQKEEIKQSIKKALTNIYKNKGKLPMVTKSEQGGFKRILSEEERKAYWDVKNSIFQKYQKKLTEALIVVFQKQRRSTLIKLGKQDKMYEFSHSIKESGNDMYKKIKLDKKKEIEVTLGISMPIIEQLFKEAGDETFELLQIDAEMDINDDEIQKLLRSKGRKFAGEMVDTTNDVIRKEIIAGVGKGETINELKNRLKGVFTDAEEFRAERIARTESLRFNVSASEQAFIDSGIVEGKKWITNPNACEFCLELAGKTIGLGKVFLKKGDTLSPTGEDVRVFDYEDLPGPPLHPNCECDLEPIFIETKSIEEAITPVQKVSKHVHRHAKYN